MRQSFNITLAISVMLIIILVGCLDNDTNNESSDTKSSLSDAIILIDENIFIPPIASEESVIYYKGKIHNTADTSFDTVTVVVSFFDDLDTYLGEKSDLLTDVKANEERNFQVTVSNTDPFFMDIDHISYEFMVN